MTAGSRGLASLYRTNARPIIGIPVSRLGRDTPDYAVRQVYCAAVARAGGAPILIPILEENPLQSVYGVLGGLLLVGGGDVAGQYYGKPDSGKLISVDSARDEVELALCRWAMRDALPILGICRGLQVLNVAAGGTLIQDIPSERLAPLVHSADRTLPRNHIQHTVQVRRGSLLGAALSERDAISFSDSAREPHSYGVNSYHHQAVDQLAPGFEASAHAADGVVEAIELASRCCFVLGVQWHPECMVPGDRAMERLFTSFVGACRARAQMSRPRAGPLDAEEVHNETGECSRRASCSSRSL